MYSKIHKEPFVQAVSKGIGQIMLQENSLTGVLFLLGVFLGGIYMGTAALCATVIATLTATIFKFDKTIIQRGLYGFNAALVGVAVMLFLKPTLFVWMIVLFGSILSTLIHHLFIKYNLPLFTFPFVVVTWLILYLTSTFIPQLLLETYVSSISYPFAYVLRGYGQVIFQDKVLSGLLFFVAVFINSPIAALYGLAGGVITALLSVFFQFPIDDIGNGLFSYNAVLCAITFAGNAKKDSLWVLVSVLLSFLVSYLFYQLKWMPLTFPFVASAFVLTLIKKKYA